MKSPTILTAVILMLAAPVYAQLVQVPFDSEKWDTENAQFTHTTYRGQDAILFDRGRMFLDEQFLNGTIEYDIHFSAQRNFPRIEFRVRKGKSEQFYVRPHQSGNPDANQYTPVFNGVTGWQLYHGEKYATQLAYDFRIWHHVKIEVKGSQAIVYFDDMEKPLLEIEELLTGVEPGGFVLGTGGAVYLANFQYTKDDQAYDPVTIPSATDETYVTDWQVSNLLSDALLDGKVALEQHFVNGLQWQEGQSETSGILNLARYNQRSDGMNTAIARVNIRADQAMTKMMLFGFSDRVTVFVNGKAVFAGDDGFVTRDYRFLGTVGFFDALYLPLQEGDNEVLFVVTERFGGWGVQAKFEDIEGISF